MSLIMAIAYALWLARLINFGVKTANEICIANEVAANNLAILVKQLTNERPVMLRSYGIRKFKASFFGSAQSWLTENGQLFGLRA
jgi:hypothetical protein